MSQGKTDEIEKKHQKEIDEIKKSYKTNKGKVVDYLVEKIFEVNIELPDVLKRKKVTKNN